MQRKTCLIVIMSWWIAVCCPQSPLGARTAAAEPVDSAGTKADEVVLEEIVVTATGDVKMRDTPASISVITAKDIEARGIKNIGEALAKVAGVFDDGSSSYYFSLRGTRSSSSGGPLVLVDGVRQDVGMLSYNYFETIPVAEIERIEILRSPGSTVFGADSARGIISIVTKKADKKKEGLKASVSASAGSWGTFDESATLSGTVDQWDLLFAGSRTDTDGYLHNQQERSAARVKAGYSFSDQARLGLNLSYKDNHWQTVRGKNRYALEIDRQADEFQASPTAKLTSCNETDQEASSLGLDFGYKGEDLFFDLLGAVTRVDEDHDARYATYTSPKSVYRDDRNQDRYTVDFSGGYRFGHGFFQYTPKLGFNLESTALEQRRDYYNDPVGKAASKRKADIDFDQEKAGFFLQNQFLLGDQWELNAGARWDEVSYEVENRNNNRVDTRSSNTSWSMAPAYHWNDRATSYVSIGKSYWYPVAYYYQEAMQYMNPENLPEDLEPESCMVYEIGHKHSFSRALNVNLAFFWMDYRDKFAVFYDSTQSYAGYKNTGDSEHKGVELEVDGRPLEWFGYRLSGTYMKAEWTSGRERVYTWETATSQAFRDLEGYDLNRTPRYKYTVGCDFYPLEKLKLNVDMNGTGPYYVDYLNRIEHDGEITFDAGIRYDLAHWSFWVLGKNIFDTEIESVFNSSGKLNSGAAEIARNGLYDNEYYPRDGQYFEAGVTYRF